jgi:hypothetical protein
MHGLDDHRCPVTIPTTTMTASCFGKEPTVVISLVQLAVVAVPLILAVLVVDTLRVASRMGGLPPFTSTHRAYSA